MSRTCLAARVAVALIGSLLSGNLARAQVVVPAPPPPVYVAPPVYVPPPPPVYVAPAVAYDPQRAHDRMLARVFTGIGSTALVLGFFSLMAGIPVLVLTSTHDLCRPTSTHSCDGYYALSYGLIGGGVGMMVAGTALDIVGSVYRIRARYASIDVVGPRVALLPAADGKLGGAALTGALRF
jgi:hypothetical protein